MANGELVEAGGHGAELLAAVHQPLDSVEGQRLVEWAAGSRTVVGARLQDHAPFLLTHHELGQTLG